MSQRRSAASGQHSSSDASALRRGTSPALIVSSNPVTTTTTTTTTILHETDDDPTTRAAFLEERSSLVPSSSKIQPVGVSALQLEPEAPDENSDGDDDGDDEEDGDSSSDARFQRERHRRRVEHWKKSPFAVGLVPPTWHDEKWRTRNWYGDRDLQVDETGCLCCTAHLCPKAGRVGNMVVLKSSHEWVEEVEIDDETGHESIRRYTRPKLDCVVGPYWPMMAFVTYPLIIGVSGWTFVTKVVTGKIPILLSLVWTILTTGLIAALAMTACRDPGIQLKTLRPPAHQENQWRWTDRAHSYRPRGAFYDSDTAVIVEGFDHTCVELFSFYCCCRGFPKTCVLSSLTRALCHPPCSSLLRVITLHTQLSLDWYRHWSEQHDPLSNLCVSGICVHDGQHFPFDRCARRGTVRVNKQTNKQTTTSKKKVSTISNLL